MISKDSIENLKNQLDVVDVVSNFLELRKAGANFKACCPFHGEDTPSFVVSPAKQIYHCFGCGVGGDSIKFVMEYEKLSYPEAIEKLASMYNFHLTYDNSNYKKQDIKILEIVNEYYQKLFINNPNAQEYIRSRGISSFNIEKFELGFAPSSNQTVSYLQNNALNLGEAKELGVIDHGTNGLYARFIDRITFPIYGINGKLVGFGGRTISGHNAKYINSPQTKVFNKSKLLYGYNLAKETIYKKHKIIVTEGYLDVIMLHQAGFENAVATLGTALTKEHLPLLKRGEPDVILAYDGDKAGLNAAYKASLLLSASEFDGGVVIFGEGKDPADMVNEGRIEELNQMFSRPQPFVPYIIDFIISNYNINIPEQKQNAVTEINDFLKTLSPILQEEYRRYVASRLNINEKFIKVENGFAKRKNEINLAKVDIAELCIIKTILEKPEYLDYVLDTVDASMFESHRFEFELALNEPNDTRLMGILLNDKLELYDENRLNRELGTLQIKFYNKKLAQVNYDGNLSFKEKAFRIREYKEKIVKLNHKLRAFI